MATYRIEDKTLVDIADAIRNKTSNPAKMTPLAMPAAIASIVSGGGGLNPDDYDITYINHPPLNTSFNRNIEWANWGDYITNPEEDIEMIFYLSEYQIVFYAKDFFPTPQKHERTSGLGVTYNTVECLTMFYNRRDDYLADKEYSLSFDSYNGNPIGVEIGLIRGDNYSALSAGEQRFTNIILVTKKKKA